MAKGAYSLDKGFLIPYSYLDMLDVLDDESVGTLIRASIKRQREATPFPDVTNDSLKIAMIAFEALIVNRLQGQKGGQKKK